MTVGASELPIKHKNIWAMPVKNGTVETFSKQLSEDPVYNTYLELHSTGVETSFYTRVGLFVTQNSSQRYDLTKRSDRAA